MHGTIKKTAGGLTMKDIHVKKKRDGSVRYVSRKKHTRAKRKYRQLVKAGILAPPWKPLTPAERKRGITKVWDKRRSCIKEWKKKRAQLKKKRMSSRKYSR